MRCAAGQKTSAQRRPRSALTERAWLAALRRVQAKETVAAVAGDRPVGWPTVLRAVVDDGAPLVDDPDRLTSLAVLGVDEHGWVPASAHRRTGDATGLVDLTPGRPTRLRDVVAGPTGTRWTPTGSPHGKPPGASSSTSPRDPFRG